MRVRIDTVLATSAERAWRAVLTPRLLLHVAAPLVMFEAVEPPAFPKVWSAGRYRVRIRAFWLIPLGEQWVGIELPETEPGTYAVRDNGGGQLVRVWNHMIIIRAIDGGRCAYRDEVEVRAGPLTPFVWLFAQLFYRHRQRRWRALVARGFEYGR
jgi:hypothetical protein